MPSDQFRLEEVRTTAQTLGTFTCHELAAEAGVHETTARACMRTLRKSGEILEAGRRGRQILFEAVLPRRVQMERNLPRTPEQSMWTVLGALKATSPSHLSMVATLDDLEITPAMALSYLKQLEKGGYVREVRQKGKGAEIHYRLRNRTGPKAPVQARIYAVWDPNLGEYTHTPEPPAGAST